MHRRVRWEPPGRRMLGAPTPSPSRCQVYLRTRRGAPEVHEGRPYAGRRPERATMPTRLRSPGRGAVAAFSASLGYRHQPVFVSGDGRMARHRVEREVMGQLDAREPVGSRNSAVISDLQCCGRAGNCHAARSHSWIRQPKTLRRRIRTAARTVTWSAGMSPLSGGRGFLARCGDGGCSAGCTPPVPHTGAAAWRSASGR